MVPCLWPMCIRLRAPTFPGCDIRKASISGHPTCRRTNLAAGHVLATNARITRKASSSSFACGLGDENCRTLPCTELLLGRLRQRLVFFLAVRDAGEHVLVKLDRQRRSGGHQVEGVHLAAF